VSALVDESPTGAFGHDSNPLLSLKYAKKRDTRMGIPLLG